MNVIAMKTLREFWGRYPDSEQALKAWAAVARRATWGQPADVKADLGTASILKESRVVFNIKGNDYRLVVEVAYDFGIVYVKFIGTHRQYDEIDANTVKLEK